MPARTSHQQPIRVAIVGTGAIARGSHLPALAALTAEQPLEIVAAVDVSADSVAAFCADAGIAHPYTDLDLMLAEQRPDLVTLCTPPRFHRDQTVTALRAGAWVWCEKPPCPSLEDFDAIEAAEGGAETGGPYAAIVFQHRFGSGSHQVRRLLAEQAMGRPLVAHCQTTWYRDEAYYSVPWRGSWSSEGGGPAMGHGIHQMDLLLDLLGPWSEIRAMAGRLVHAVETEDVSTALVRFENGALATVVNSVLSPDEVSRIRIDCERATVELTHLYGHRNADWRITPAPGVSPNRRPTGGTSEPTCPVRTRRSCVACSTICAPGGGRAAVAPTAGRASNWSPPCTRPPSPVTPSVPVRSVRAIRTTAPCTAMPPAGRPSRRHDIRRPATAPRRLQPPTRSFSDSR